MLSDFEINSIIFSYRYQKCLFEHATFFHQVFK